MSDQYRSSDNTNQQSVRDALEEVGLPKAIGSEKIIFSAMFLDDTDATATRVAAALKPNEFYLDSHKRIYRAVLEMLKARQPIDLIMLGDKLEASGELYTVGGRAYLAELIDGGFRPSRLGDYIQEVKVAALRRQAANASHKAASAALDPNADIQQIIAEMQESVTILTQKTQDDPILDSLEVARARLQFIEELAERGSELVGISTGFKLMDRYTAGLQPANLFILAARPSIGKSALALCIAKNAAAAGELVAFFSMEMTANELIDRLLCLMALVDGHLYRVGRLSREEWKALGAALSKFAEFSKNLIIEEKPSITPTYLRAALTRIKAERGKIGLVIVDYLQLMESDQTFKNQTEKIGRIARELKSIAKEFGVPMLALCQMNRDIERRNDEEPQLSDLRESGEIEQHADLVMFLTRPNKDRADVEDNFATCFLKKQRNGPTGRFDLAYIPKFTRFENMFNA